ncbi:MAG: RNA polymerase sigma factor [Bacteroidales bacterium]|nr:RNA polymerase sigma factor [Bacteroidales bacterium]
MRLYKRYAPVLLGVALRYSSNKSEAEDVLQEAFIKIYTKMHTYTFNGSFEGWLKRIVINTAINHNRSNVKEKLTRELNDADEYDMFVDDSNDLSHHQYSADQLMKSVQNLPDGYRTVFNMFVMEGYSHKEISTMLEVSESTSKSQLFKARGLLRKQLLSQNEYQSK